MRVHLLSCNPRSAGSLCVQSHAAAKSHLHTDYERGLSHCLSRCRRAERSESELEQDAVKNDTVFSVQLIPQPLEECCLLRSKCLAVEIVSLRNLDPATVASPHRLNGIRAGKNLQVTTDRRISDMELMRQVVAGIVPPYAQHLQQSLPALSWGHTLTPFRHSLELTIKGKQPTHSAD